MVDGKDMPRDERGYDYVWVFVCKFSRLIARLPGNKTDTAEKLAKRYCDDVQATVAEDSPGHVMIAITC